jgi:hypothetical protein
MLDFILVSYVLYQFEYLILVKKKKLMCLHYHEINCHFVSVNSFTPSINYNHSYL